MLLKDLLTYLELI